MDEMELFSRVLDGEAGEDERTVMERSLAENPLLREEWDRWRAMDALLRSIPAESPSPRFAEAVMRWLPAASPDGTPWLWGLAWAGGVLLSGMLIAGVLAWCLTLNPTWVTSAVALIVLSAQVARTALDVWAVWGGAMAAVIQDFAVPVAVGVAMYTALAVALVGALFRCRHAARLL